MPNLTKPTSSLPLYNDEPPELDEVDDTDKKRKPIGGVSIFGGANLFENKETLKQKAVVESNNEPPKKISLFADDDDDDNLFDDDLFSNISAKKFTSGLFNDDLPKVSLFDPNPPPDTDDWQTKSSSVVDVVEQEAQPLFSSTAIEKSGSLDDLFSPLKIPPAKNAENTKKKPARGLFDDDDDDLEDDLFSKNTSDVRKSDANKKNVDNTNKNEEKKVGLFDDDLFSKNSVDEDDNNKKTDDIVNKIEKNEEDEEKKENKSSSNFGLFDDGDHVFADVTKEDHGGLFGDVKINQIETEERVVNELDGDKKEDKSKIVGLFEDVRDDGLFSDDVFASKSSDVIKQNDTKIEKNLDNIITKDDKSTGAGLFDVSDDELDKSLFSAERGKKLPPIANTKPVDESKEMSKSNQSKSKLLFLCLETLFQPIKFMSLFFALHA